MWLSRVGLSNFNSIKCGFSAKCMLSWLWSLLAIFAAQKATDAMSMSRDGNTITIEPKESATATVSAFCRVVGEEAAKRRLSRLIILASHQLVLRAHESCAI